MYRLVVSSALVLLLASACAIDEAEPLCDKGETQACACETGTMGAQSCADDGFAWGECKCEEPEPGEPQACERDADCTDSALPVCVNFECATGEGVTILGGGARCDVPRSRCADGLRCDPEAQRCLELGD